MISANAEVEKGKKEANTNRNDDNRIYKKTIWSNFVKRKNVTPPLEKIITNSIDECSSII